MGSRWKTASPDFRIGGRGDAAHGEGWDKGVSGEEEPPPSPRTIGGSKNPRSKRMGSGREGVGLGNSGPRTRIPRQLIGGNADELPERTENEGRVLGELVSPSKLPPNPTPIGPRGRWRDRGGWVPKSRNPLPRANPPPKRPAERGDLRRKASSEGLHLRSLAIPPDRRTRRRAGRDGPGFSIGRRSLGSAPIENPRPSSGSGRPPPSLGLVERAEGRPTAERCAELGGGRNNRR